MLGLVAELLPVGLGVAANPIAVAVVLLLVGAEESRRASIAFLGGWVSGLTILLVPATLALSAGWQRGQAEHGHALDLVWRTAGGLMLVAGLVACWPRRRPASTEPPVWARRLEGAPAGRVSLLGAGLAVFSLRNLLLVAGFALIVARAQLSPAGNLAAYAVFVVLATASLLVPVLMQRFGGPGAAARLEAWQVWLAAHGSQLAGLVIALLGARLLLGS